MGQIPARNISPKFVIFSDGRRIAKECLQTQQQTHYLWDGSTLIQQSQITADGTALTSTEYLYEPGSHRPMAQVTTRHNSNRQDLHYIVTDHAGTPQELVREDGEIEWRGEQALWGKYQQQQFNLKIQRGYLEDAANEALTCDLRYQGQIEDRESGLYYNLNRYYDTDSGQYLSPDPIGFAGGLRPQGYVDNPAEYVDPLGLVKECKNPQGYSTGDVDEHGRLSPGVNRANGHKNTKTDGLVQSHHPIQDHWAKKRIEGYKRNDAPATLLKSSSGSPHAKISAAQRARRANPNGWNTTLKEEFNISYREMLDADVPANQAKKSLKDSYKYFDSLRESNINNVFFDI